MVAYRIDGLHLGTKGLAAPSSLNFQNYLAFESSPVLP